MKSAVSNAWETNMKSKIFGRVAKWVTLMLYSSYILTWEVLLRNGMHLFGIWRSINFPEILESWICEVGFVLACTEVTLLYTIPFRAITSRKLRHASFLGMSNNPTWERAIWCLKGHAAGMQGPYLGLRRSSFRPKGALCQLEMAFCWPERHFISLRWPFVSLTGLCFSPVLA